jgi:hypothetical protein
MVDSPPAAISPAALLNPCAGLLLPTWIYVGGPSEIAYHATGQGLRSPTHPAPADAPASALRW